MKNKIWMAVLTMTLTLCLITGCGAKKSKGYDTAVDMLNVLWENSSKSFAAFGGNYDNNVEDAPGTLDLSDTGTMTYMLLIPDEVQPHITDAATLFHLMNTNTFTAAALKLDGLDAAETANQIRDFFVNNPFLCGTPEKIVIYSVGNDLVYFFGEMSLVDEFKTAAEKLDGAKLLVEERY